MEASYVNHPGGPVPVQMEHLLLWPVIEKADRWLGNFTSNLAESWMSIRTEVDGGQDGLLGDSMQGCFNLGMNWSLIAWQ